MRLVVEKTFFNVITAEDEEKDKVRTLTRSMSAPTLGTTREEADTEMSAVTYQANADITRAPLQPVTATGQTSAGAQQRLRGRMFASESYARLKQRSFASQSTTASKINLQMLFDEDSDSEEPVVASVSPSPPAVRELPPQGSFTAAASSSSAASSVGPLASLGHATAAPSNLGMSTTTPAGQVPAPVSPTAAPGSNLVPVPFVRGPPLASVVAQVGPTLPTSAVPVPLVPPQAFNAKAPVNTSVAYGASMPSARCNGSLVANTFTPPVEPTVTEASPMGSSAVGPLFSTVDDVMAGTNFPTRDIDAFSHPQSGYANQNGNEYDSFAISRPPSGSSGVACPIGGVPYAATSRANGPNCNGGASHAVGGATFGPVGSRSPADTGAFGGRDFGRKGPLEERVPFAPGARRGGLRKMRAELNAAVKASGITALSTSVNYFEPVHEEADEDDEPSHLGVGYSAFGSVMGDTSLGRNPLPVDSYSRGAYGGNNVHDNCFGSNNVHDNCFGSNNVHDHCFGGNNVHDNCFGGNSVHDNRFGGNDVHNNRFGGNNVHERCNFAGGGGARGGSSGAFGPVGVAGGSLQCCGGCGLGACCNAGNGSHAGCGASSRFLMHNEDDQKGACMSMIGPLAPEFQLPRISKYHSFHREVRHFGDLSPDGRRFTKRAFENRLSLVCEGTVQTGGQLRYLVQFNGGQLSTADGVGFVFCRKLPCPKDIQQIVSIFLNRHGAICLRAHSELVRLNTRLRPLALHDWIEVEIDLDNEHATFTLWPCDEENHDPLVGSFAYAETFVELRNRAPRRVAAPQKQRGGNRSRRDVPDATGVFDPLPPLDLHCGYLACVVKNLGVSLQLGS